MDRRIFLKSGLTSYLKALVKETSLSIFADSAVTKNDDYFNSVFSCYPLLSEAPYEMLVEAARKLGINPKNKTKLELAREVFGERRQ